MFFEFEHLFEFERLSDDDKTLYKYMLNRMLAFQPQIDIETRSFEDGYLMYQRILQDHPEIFWTKGASGMKREKQNGDTAVEMSPIFNDHIPIKNAPAMLKEMKAVVDSIETKVRNMNTYSKILYVHDYIIDTTDYEFGENCYSSYGCLVEHKAVCAGYAKAFQLILQHLGIPCGRVTGSSADSDKVDHEWNFCKINDDYCFIDVTWDDPHFVGENSSHKTHEYFCVSTRDLKRSHMIAQTQFFVPECKSNMYNYYVRTNTYVGIYSFQKVCPMILRQLKDSDEAVLKFATKENTEKAIDDLITHHRVDSVTSQRKCISYSTSKSGLILSIGFGPAAAKNSSGRIRVIRKSLG